MIITIALIEMEKSNIKLYIQWVTNDISFRIFDIHEVSNYFKEFVNGLPCFEFNLDSKWQHTGNKMNKAKCTHTQNEYQENNQLNVSFKSKINFRNDRISIGSIFWAYLYCYYCFFSYVSYWWQFFFFFSIIISLNVIFLCHEIILYPFMNLSGRLLSENLIRIDGFLHIYRKLTWRNTT